MSAQISECGHYRYVLTRECRQLPWCEDYHYLNQCPPICSLNQRKTVFVMLNPSTADAVQDDPTIRRCVGFAEAWGSAGLIVANLYAMRSADPRALWQHNDPVGPENDAILAELALEHRDIICAWGANARADRVQRFINLMEAAGANLFCLGRTKHGAPRHPLYLKSSAEPQPWALP